jgi:hypothetical protein
MRVVAVVAAFELELLVVSVLLSDSIAVNVDVENQRY